MSVASNVFVNFFENLIRQMFNLIDKYPLPILENSKNFHPK